MLTLACASTSSHGLLTRGLLDPAGVVRGANTIEEIGYVEGRACRFFIVALLPVGNSSVGRAMRNALEGTEANAVLNASVTTSLYGFVPIYNVLSFTCTTVQGTAVRIAAAPPAVSSQLEPAPPSAPTLAPDLEPVAEPEPPQPGAGEPPGGG
ncbi:MAG: hypothetical protein ACQGVK_15475 [Myxococcota bacterium]